MKIHFALWVVITLIWPLETVCYHWYTTTTGIRISGQLLRHQNAAIPAQHIQNLQPSPPLPPLQTMFTLNVVKAKAHLRGSIAFLNDNNNNSNNNNNNNNISAPPLKLLVGLEETAILPTAGGDGPVEPVSVRTDHPHVRSSLVMNDPVSPVATAASVATLLPQQQQQQRREPQSGRGRYDPATTGSTKTSLFHGISDIRYFTRPHHQLQNNRILQPPPQQEQPLPAPHRVYPDHTVAGRWFWAGVYALLMGGAGMCLGVVVWYGCVRHCHCHDSSCTYCRFPCGWTKTSCEMKSTSIGTCHAG